MRAARLQDDLGLREIEDGERPACRVGGGCEQQLGGRFGEGGGDALARNNRATLVDLHPDVRDAAIVKSPCVDQLDRKIQPRTGCPDERGGAPVENLAQIDCGQLIAPFMPTRLDQYGSSYADQ